MRNQNQARKIYIICNAGHVTFTLHKHRQVFSAYTQNLNIIRVLYFTSMCILLNMCVYNSVYIYYAAESNSTFVLQTRALSEKTLRHEMGIQFHGIEQKRTQLLRVN